MSDAPKNGWTCFHCGETFRCPSAAAEHFGINEFVLPGCIAKVNPGGERGLLQALRKSETELANTLHSLHEESSSAMMEMRAMQGRHAENLRRAEEAGYQRALDDVRKEAAA